MGNKTIISKPIVYRDPKGLPKDKSIIDAFSNSLEELFYVRNPELKKGQGDYKQDIEKFIKKNKIEKVWIYYPNEDKLICIPEEEVYFELRTSRNRNLISRNIQKKYRNIIVGVIGLSVGSSIVNYISYTGGPRKMKLADFDSIELTNLNRINANLLDYGKNKAEVAAEKVWNIDPFADLYLYPEGISENDLESFITTDPKLDVLIDAMDSLSLKIKARLICRENKIPVIMATSNGDSIIIDIERFDLETDRPLFHNKLGDIQEKDFKSMNYKEWLTLATKIVGESSLTLEMKDSIKEIGKTISSVPQLSTTVNLGGIVISYILRQIAFDKNRMKSGRYVLGIKDCF